MIDSIEVVYYTSIFILPGFLIKGIINAMSPKSKTSELLYLLSCLFYSIISFALLGWLYIILYNNRFSLSNWYWIILIFSTLVGSTLFAIVLGIVKQKEIISKIFNSSKLNHIHPTPTAWDYYFSKQKPVWVIITLHDGSLIYGRFGSKSFASSESEERDIYIEEVFGIDKDNLWIKNELSKGILVSKNNIKTIEFLK